MLASDVERVVGLRPNRFSVLKEREQLPFDPSPGHYSPMDAFLLNVQGAIVDNYQHSPKTSAVILKNALQVIFEQWQAITHVPGTTLVVFLRADREHPSERWVAKVARKGDIKVLLDTLDWDLVWQVDLHDQLTQMCNRAKERNIALPSLDAPLAEWQKRSIR